MAILSICERLLVLDPNMDHTKYSEIPHADKILKHF